MRSSRGIALLVVLGILGVLAVLATAFMTLARMERRASHRRTHATRAFLLARSGLEDVLARLASGQDPDRSPGRWGASDADADGVLNVVERAQHVGAVPTPEEDLEACRIRDALRPTWAVLEASGSAVLEGVDGRRRGASGRMASGSYSVRVSREEGLYVNGGDPTAGPAVGYNAVLGRILGTLAEGLRRELGRPVLQDDGLALLLRRPASGWRDLDHVAEVLGWSRAKVEAFRPYLAFRAWTDKRVIVPNASPAPGMDVHNWGSIKLQRPASPSGSREPDFERIGGRVVGRAPVSLPWAARHKPVLVALIAGLSGVYLDESYAAAELDVDGGDADSVGLLRRTLIFNGWSSTDNCHRAASAIAATWCSGDPTWQDFEAFCDTLPFGAAVTGTTAERQALRDIVKANFNPNSDLNKFNPDRSHWRSVDKADLQSYSTEFCPGPSPRGCEVESSGRVTGPGGELLAQRTLKAVLDPPGILRLSTQREFVCEDLGSLDLPGDETDPRLPGHFRYVSESRGGERTWGHALDLRARYGSGCFLNGDVLARGASVQSHPEPCFDAGGGLEIRPADYDGSLRLATVETPKDAFYTQASPAGVHEMKMLARFTQGLDLDEADGNPACQADGALVTRAELSHGLLHGSQPSTLYPDGAYSESGRCPSWLDRDNADGFHGVMSFWVKNSFVLEPTVRSASGRGRRYVYWSNLVSREENSCSNQFFFLGTFPWAGIQTYLQFENGRRNEDDAEEHEFYAISPVDFPRRWRLLSLFWDFRGQEVDDIGELVVDGGSSSAELGSEDHYSDSRVADPFFSDDITADDSPDGGPLRPHRISLGPGARFIEFSEIHDRMGLGADATFDEFCIWDFGGGTADSGVDFSPGDLPRTLAAERYKEGRYYRGAAYDGLGAAPQDGQAASWLSAPISLPPGSRVLAVSWTFRRPAALPTDFAELALASPSGDAYLLDEGLCRSVLDCGWDPRLQHWEPGMVVPGPFRLQAVFRRRAPLADDVPVLDSPALDDLTVTWQPREGPRIASWHSE